MPYTFLFAPPPFRKRRMVNLYFSLLKENFRKREPEVLRILLGNYGTKQFCTIYQQILQYM